MRVWPSILTFRFHGADVFWMVRCFSFRRWDYLRHPPPVGGGCGLTLKEVRRETPLGSDWIRGRLGVVLAVILCRPVGIGYQFQDQVQ